MSGSHNRWQTMVEQMEHYNKQLEAGKIKTDSFLIGSPDYHKKNIISHNSPTTYSCDDIQTPILITLLFLIICMVSFLTFCFFPTDLKHENKLRLKDKQKYCDALAGVTEALCHVKSAMEEVKQYRGNCKPDGDNNSVFQGMEEETK